MIGPLGSEVVQNTSAANKLEYEGFVEEITRSEIRGWCVLRENPSLKIELEVLFDGELIGTATTGASRTGAVESFEAPDLSGFAFRLDRGLALTMIRELGDDELTLATLPSRFVVRIAATGEVLPHSPGLALRLGPSSPPKFDNPTPAELKTDIYRGCVESCLGGVIAGWCVSESAPTAPIELEVYFDDVLLGTCQTSISRPDIAGTLRVPVRAGFEFHVSETASASLGPALELLSTVVDDHARLSAMIDVRVAKSSFRLSVAATFSITQAEATALLSTITEQFQVLTRNRHVIEVADVLRLSPAAHIAPSDDVRIVAFYLPQFHPFPQNNDWWGPGFTEWTNVTTAKPSFANHYQPRLPADLGFYDLRLDSVHQAQIDLAKKYGISAFCYHYYYFSGTTVMTLPVERHAEQNYDLDFCICWANENWSRRWDGSEADVLLGQQHSLADDVAFIESVIKYFEHPRYIKINGAPLLVVYRISILSDPPRVIDAWREIVKRAGFPDLHVCMAETFGTFDPNQFGADSTVEFPPHHNTASVRRGDVTDLTPGFAGAIFDYADAASLEVRRKDAAYLRFRTIIPSWDNTSRKGLEGFVFHNASPQLFEAWLSFLIADSRAKHPAGSRFVFINAWNEWAEGAYLEPDRRYGHAYLRAVRNALSSKGAMYGELINAARNPALAPLVESVSRFVTTIANANSSLSKFLTEGPRLGGVPSVFIPFDELEIIAKDHSGLLQVEWINGKRSSPSGAFTVLRVQNIEMVGWIRIPGMALVASKPLFVVLSSIDEHSKGTRYLASVHERKERPDVASVFPEDQPQPYEFLLEARLDAVKPGSYRIAALVPQGTDPKATYEVASDVLIHIG